MPVITSPSSGSGTTVTAPPLLGPLASFSSLGSTSTITTMVLDTTSKYAAVVFRANKAGSITDVYCYPTATTGSPTLSALIETVSSGNPSGSAHGGAVAGTTSPSANTGVWITLATPATVAVGDLIAATLSNTVGSTSATVQVACSIQGPLHAPSTQTYDGAAWTKLTTQPLIAVRYSDGEIRAGIPLAATTISGTNFSSATTPDERGLKLVAPYTGTCTGARILLDPSAVGDTDTVKLYDSSDTVIGTGTIAANENTSANVGVANVVWAEGAVTITRGQTYRLTVQATNTGNRQLRAIALPSSAERVAIAGAETAELTTRTSSVTPVAWTDDATVVPVMALRMATLEAA